MRLNSKVIKWIVWRGSWVWCLGGSRQAFVHPSLASNSLCCREQPWASASTCYVLGRTSLCTRLGTQGRALCMQMNYIPSSGRGHFKGGFTLHGTATLNVGSAVRQTEFKGESKWNPIFSASWLWRQGDDYLTLLLPPPGLLSPPGHHHHDRCVLKPRVKINSSTFICFCHSYKRGDQYIWGPTSAFYTRHLEGISDAIRLSKKQLHSSAKLWTWDFPWPDPTTRYKPWRKKKCVHQSTDTQTLRVAMLLRTKK